MDRVRGQDRVSQRGRRGLALGPGDADRRGRAEAEEQVRLADEGRGVGIPSSPRRHQGLELGTEPRLGRRIARRDRRRGRDEGRAGPGRRGVDPGPEAKRHVAVPEQGDGALERPGRTAVVDGDPGAGVREEAGERDAAPGEPQHRHRPPVEGAGAHGVQGEGVEVDRAHGHLTSSALIDAMNRVTPRRPARTPTIQKRNVIFSSSQPPSSKWWCSGAIRNTRLPPESL